MWDMLFLKGQRSPGFFILFNSQGHVSNVNSLTQPKAGVGDMNDANLSKCKQTPAVKDGYFGLHY